jgi:hypothetical protein
MIMRAKCLCVLAAIVAVLVVTRPATAANSVLSLLTSGSNLLQDSSGDIIVPLSSGAGTSSTIVTGPSSPGAGDGTILLSAFQIDTITNGAGGPTSINQPNYTTLTGLVAIQAVGETITGSGSNTQYTLQFGPATSATDLAAIGAISPAASAAVASWSSKSLVAFYEGTYGGFSLAGTGSAALDSDLASTTAGTELWQLGFSSTAGTGGANTAGQGWSASTPTNNINLLPTIGNEGLVNYELVQTGGSNYLLALFQPESPFFGPGLVDLAGNSNLFGLSTTNTPFQADDNANASISIEIAPVPEPTTLLLAWSGLAMVGCGLALGRRKVCRV